MKSGSGKGSMQWRALLRECEEAGGGKRGHAGGSVDRHQGKTDGVAIKREEKRITR